jgi:hypothetical protein
VHALGVCALVVARVGETLEVAIPGTDPAERQVLVRPLACRRLLADAFVLRERKSTWTPDPSKRRPTKQQREQIAAEKGHDDSRPSSPTKFARSPERSTSPRPQSARRPARS